MKLTKLKYIALVILLSFFYSTTFAQVEDQNVVIEKESDIKIKPANKPFEKINTPKFQKDKVTLQYDYRPMEITKEKFDIPLDMIKPNSQNSDDNNDDEDYQPMRFFLRAGYGSYQTSLLEAYFQHQLNESLTYGANLKHLASGIGEIKDDFSGTSNNQFQVYGKYFLANSTLRTDLTYNRQVSRFYGYDLTQLENFSKNDLKQVYNRIGLNLNYANTDSESNFIYDLGLQIKNWSDDFNASEFQASLLGKMTYILNEDSNINIEFLANTTQVKYQESLNRTFTQLKPYYQFENGSLNAKIGINLFYENDTISTTDNIHLYPVIEAGYQIAEAMTVFAGFEGAMEQTSLDQFSAQNPWLDTTAQVLIHRNKLWEGFGGIKGKINAKLSYNARVGLSRYKNLDFFINNPLDSAKFSLAYETDESNIFSIAGSINYDVNNQFLFTFSGNIYNYDLPNLDKAYHRPNLDFTLTATYLPFERLLLQADLQWLDGIDALQVSDNQNISLDSIIDLSFKGDYLISDKFSAFLSLNNLFSNNYQRYLNYPTQGFNFLIGLKYGL